MNQDKTRFEACPNCGTHGFIILKDGRRSERQFRTKPGALAEVERILSLSLIDSEEASTLRDQITQSNLREDGEELDEETLTIAGIAIVATLGDILSALSDDPEDNPFLRKIRRDQRKAPLN